MPPSINHIFNQPCSLRLPEICGIQNQSMLKIVIVPSYTCLETYPVFERISKQRDRDLRINLTSNRERINLTSNREQNTEHKAKIMTLNENHILYTSKKERDLLVGDEIPTRYKTLN